MNLMESRLIYRIRKLRLVNFHNFQNETIEIDEGGHLFLLGDNGSGKTTVLDAVHYVLSGGNRMEFNSAARMSGSRGEGRKAQGIIMRYNIETGPLNPGGGVSYAAIEFCCDNAAPVTVAVGLQAFSMDERVQRWGIIHDGPIDEIAWLTDENGQLRVTSQREMRDALKERGEFYGIGAYEKELARRFFGTEEIFNETCRFISMGKAYREIASSAADYHELFKTLLPEPKTDLFERIVEALRTLDQATLLLEEMQKKLAYLESLEALVKLVKDSREAVARYRWISFNLEKESLTQKSEELRLEIDDTTKKLEAIRESIEEAQDERVTLLRQLDDLRRSDSAGLVRQEKEIAADYERSCGENGRLEAELERCTSSHNDAKKAVENARSTLQETLDALSRCASGPAAAEIDLGILQQCTGVLSMVDPANAWRDLHFDDVLDRLENRSTALHLELDGVKRHIDDIENRIAAVAREIETLRESGVVSSLSKEFKECLTALGEEGIEARALYECLEWRGDLDIETRSAIEEAIGEEILFTILAPPEDYERARLMVLRCSPRIRIATTPASDTETAPWLRTSFDFGFSDPVALTVLAEEMITRSGPEIIEIESFRALHFRAHQYRLSAAPAQWIGVEERKKAVFARIAVLEQQLHEFGKEKKQTAKSMATIEQRIDDLSKFRERIRDSIRAAGVAVDRFATAGREEAWLSETVIREQKRFLDAAKKAEYLKARLGTLREHIHREGLDDLESKITQLDSAIYKCDTRIRSGSEDAGSLKTSIADKTRQIAQNNLIMEGLLSDMEETALAIRACAGSPISDIEYYVLRTWKGAQFKNAESVQASMQDVMRREQLSIGSLREKLHDPVFGAIFGFSYTEDTNLLIDRRNQSLGDIAVSQRGAIDEQRKVINEKTEELFTRIIVNEMVSFFARHLSRLDSMVRTINRYLGQRTFGTTTYRLELQKEERFKSFIEAVQRFNPFDPKARDALRQFIDDHRDAIVNAEVDGVPEVLDYRNWYTYHLRMSTGTSAGVIMDRRTKSVGSGGEQAVPNYLTILTIAHFLFHGNRIRIHALLFDEAFYGIDAGRRDQLLGFAGDLGLQLLVASPDQDGVRREVRQSTTILVVKDPSLSVHLYPYTWANPQEKQLTIFETPEEERPVEFGEEIFAGDSGDRT